MAEKKNPATDMSKDVAIKRVIPDDLLAQYVDGMVVKNQDGLFNLYFFQNRWPIALTAEDIQAIDTVESRCITHLVMTPDQMRKNIEALVENFRKFENAIQTLLESASESEKSEEK